MTKEEKWADIRKQLEEERAGRLEERAHLEEDLSYEADYGFGEGDPGIYERERAMAMIEDVNERIAEIDRALQKLEDGTYGVCEVCGEEIPIERLEIIPSTRYCVECASKAEG